MVNEIPGDLNDEDDRGAPDGRISAGALYSVQTACVNKNPLASHKPEDVKTEFRMRPETRAAGRLVLSA